MEGLCHVFFIFGLLVAGGSAAKTKSKFYMGTATWYHAADGDGSDGGACGYGTMIHANGYKTRETAVSDVLFRDGLGCGRCYKVMCYGHPLCNKRFITVVAMDQSPGGSWPHFDLSGSAFGRMAIDSRSAAGLRNVGKINIAWTRTLCKYGNKTIAFVVMGGSSAYWFSVEVEYENGAGDIASMQIKDTLSEGWQDMRHVWGASWAAFKGPLQGPFSIKLTSSSRKRGKTLTLNNVIPKDFVVGATYTSHVKFDD
ncbi:Pollen allergen [Castilleja foliolosa]|uniref:Expansin n=1 Tax=Castilleja foliolosa TaxID=1961234 RepID=A0ABD3CQR2_9LAMI